MSTRLKPGYKQTEVGVIPEEWKVNHLSAIAFLERGKFTARPRNQPRFFGGDIPFIQTGDVTNSDGTICTYTQTLNDDGLRVSKMFPRETLFFTIAANIGDVGIAAFETAATDSLVAITPKTRIDKRWLYHSLKNRKKEFEAIATQNAQLNINLEKLRPYPLAVPPPPEQRAIAEALGDVDALLSALTQLIAKKRDLKQAVMQQLLTGHQRLPSFTGEWKVKRLGELGSTYGGLSGKTKADFGEGSARYITFLNIMNNVVIDPEQFEYVRVASSERQNQALKGDLFFNGSSETPEEVGMCSVLLTDVQKLYLNSFCFGFRLREEGKANGVFLTYFFRSDEGRELLYSLAQGATRYNLSKTSLLKLVFPLPETEEQTAIAAVLSDMDAELTALEQRLDKTRALKQGMMQELLTGRTRLV